VATIERYVQGNGESRYRVRYRTPERRQTDKRGFRTKRDPEAFAAAVEAAKVRGEYISDSAESSLSPSSTMTGRPVERGSIVHQGEGGQRLARKRQGAMGYHRGRNNPDLLDPLVDSGPWQRPARKQRPSRPRYGCCEAS
jgi:hypothetical protein